MLTITPQVIGLRQRLPALKLIAALLFGDKQGISSYRLRTQARDPYRAAAFSVAKCWVPSTAGLPVVPNRAFATPAGTSLVWTLWRAIWGIRNGRRLYEKHSAHLHYEDRRTQIFVARVN